MVLKRFSILMLLIGLIISGVAFAGGANEAVEEEIITLDFPQYQLGEPWNAALIHYWIDKFEAENPNIKVNAYEVPSKVFWDQMLTRVTTGDPPDIALLRGGDIVLAQKQGLLEPLENYIDDLDPSIYSGLMMPNYIDGKTYAITHIGGFEIPIYNKQLFEEAGYTSYPEDPENWLEALKKLTDAPEQYGYGMFDQAGDPQHMNEAMAMYIAGFGGRISKDGVPTANDPKVVEALKFYKKVYDANVAPKGVLKTVYREKFANGSIATLIDGNWIYDFVAGKDPEVAKQFSSALPPFPVKETAIPTLNGGYTIPSDAKHKEAAGKFLAMYATEDLATKVLEMTKQFPYRKDVEPSPEFLAEYPWLQGFLDVEVVYLYPGLEEYENEIMKIMTTAYERVLFSNESAQVALDDAQLELEAMLKR